MNSEEEQFCTVFVLYKQISDIIKYNYSMQKT